MLTHSHSPKGGFSPSRLCFRRAAGGAPFVLGQMALLVLLTAAAPAGLIPAHHRRTDLRQMLVAAAGPVDVSVRRLLVTALFALVVLDHAVDAADVVHGGSLAIDLEVKQGGIR